MHISQTENTLRFIQTSDAPALEKALNTIRAETEASGNAELSSAVTVLEQMLGCVKNEEGTLRIPVYDVWHARAVSKRVIAYNDLMKKVVSIGPVPNDDQTDEIIRIAESDPSWKKSCHPIDALSRAYHSMFPYPVANTYDEEEDEDGDEDEDEWSDEPGDDDIAENETGCECGSCTCTEEDGEENLSTFTFADEGEDALS